MDTNQPTAPTTTYVPAPAASGIFGTKIPSSVAFAVGVLLFFMPFIDIKCNNMSLKKVSGFELATGFQMKKNSSNNPFLNDMNTGNDEGGNKTSAKSEKKDPNLFAMIALGLGVLGLGLSFVRSKAAMGGAMVIGIGAAGALIGMMLDVKKQIKADMSSMGGSNGDKGASEGFGDFGKELGDQMKITADFTPWFYVAVVAFLAAAFFCYKRMQSSKT